MMRYLALLFSLTALVAAGAAPASADSASEYTNFVGMQFVNIPAGEFLMGSCKPGAPGTCLDERAASPFASKDEFPQHRVSIPAFQLGVHEVSFGQYQQFMKDTGSEDLQDKHFSKFNVHGAQAPVVYVTRDEAQAFIAWLNQSRPESDQGRYRLPTESEWEYAARAHSLGSYPWGDEIGKNNANCKNCGSEWGGVSPAPVGSFAANAFGVHDMIGNVWEWLEDCAHPNYRNAPTDGSAWITKCSDAKGVDNGHVVRGGSWDSDAINLRSAYRNSYPHDAASDVVGFRVVRDLSGQ